MFLNNKETSCKTSAITTGKTSPPTAQVKMKRCTGDTRADWYGIAPYVTCPWCRDTVEIAGE